MKINNIWVFQGNGSDAPGGIFSTRDKAEEWISKSRVQGILFNYPVNISVYDFLVSSGSLKIRKDYQRDPKFVQKISPGYLEHYHYEHSTDD